MPANNSNIDFTKMRYLLGSISLVKKAVNTPKGIAKNKAMEVTSIVPYNMVSIPNCWVGGFHLNENSDQPFADTALQLLAINTTSISSTMKTLRSVLPTT